jgi:hypothetical protein
MNLRAPSPEGGGAPNPDGGELSRRDDEETTDLPPLNYIGEIRSALEDLVGGVDWTQTGYEGARLCDIACRALGGENVSEAILAWLRDVLLAKRGNPRPPARDLMGRGRLLTKRSDERSMPGHRSCFGGIPKPLPPESSVGIARTPHVLKAASSSFGFGDASL